MFFIVLLASLIFSCGQASEIAFPHFFSNRVEEIIERAEDLPDMKSDVFESIKGDLRIYWNQLVQNGSVNVNGTDQHFRPAFVGLQAIVEHVMAESLNREIHMLVGIIHTPAPCTPLCNKEVATVDESLVTPDLAKDPRRLYTVHARTKTIRDFYRLGGLLYIVYPQGGRSIRSAEQLAIYDNELKKNPLFLIERVLRASEIPSHLVGATYLMRDKTGKLFAFGIQMTQANKTGQGDFGLWFGPIDHPAVKIRVESVLGFIKAHAPSFNLRL